MITLTYRVWESPSLTIVVNQFRMLYLFVNLRVGVSPSYKKAYQIAGSGPMERQCKRLKAAEGAALSYRFNILSTLQDRPQCSSRQETAHIKTRHDVAPQTPEVSRFNALESPVKRASRLKGHDPFKYSQRFVDYRTFFGHRFGHFLHQWLQKRQVSICLETKQKINTYEGEI